MPPYQPRPFRLLTTDADDAAIFNSTTPLEAGAHERSLVRDCCGGGFRALPVHSFRRTRTAGGHRAALDAPLAIDRTAKMILPIRRPLAPRAFLRKQDAPFTLGTRLHYVTSGAAPEAR